MIDKPAFGDIRQAFSALSQDKEIGEVMQYRFKGGPFEGHPLGNIVLVGCWDYTNGDMEKTMKLAHKIWKLK